MNDPNILPFPCAGYLTAADSSFLYTDTTAIIGGTMQHMRHYLHLGNTALMPSRRAAKKEKAEEKLSDVVGTSHEILLNATTVFPLTLFPDTVTIDRTKLTITRRNFFATAEVVSIQIEDILNVTASVGPFFGSIQIHTRYFDPHKPYVVDKLWRDDALKIDRIMQGYSIAIKENIDLSALDSKELTNKLDELGKSVPSAKL